jgi:hypothetical protein
LSHASDPNDDKEEAAEIDRMSHSGSIRPTGVTLAYVKANTHNCCSGTGVTLILKGKRPRETNPHYSFKKQTLINEVTLC